jgi:hypothetical protein
MLKVVGMGSVCCAFSEMSTTELFQMNAPFNFYVEAPLYWWLDFDYTKFGFELGDFTEVDKLNMSVSTMVKGCAILTYQEIVTICQEYCNGVYKYTHKSYEWNNEREWNDFCETLLDVKGVRDLVDEEVF